ncbi:response regulator transcription factor [Caldimonas tepidiphila]|uniref:response regulator transcription factor n=1 Tax=Caldimonas tepidiphila TaxID=2315841 RepID=UPI000E5BF9E7|nr:response regulator transcription factor [Caldimonas tepidiphila]
MDRLRVLLADDHAVLREGLRLLVEAQPDMEVVAQAGGGREAVQLVERLRPDVVVMDVSMPDLDGAEATERLHASCPEVRVLALTRHADQGYLRRLLRAGATGYVLKKSAAEALVGAIRTVGDGGTWIDPALAGALVSHLLAAPQAEPGEAPHRADLSQREEQVLRLVAWGQSNKEIAAKLGLSVKTVESYKATAQEKLQLRCRTDIVRYALARKWLSDDQGPE